jgi:hypothetical protein
MYCFDMKLHSHIIDNAGGAEKVRELLGVRAIQTVRAWRARNSIPAQHWLALSILGLATLNELAEGASLRSAKESKLILSTGSIKKVNAEVGGA